MHASANLTTKESYLLKAQLRDRFSIALYYVIKRKRRVRRVERAAAVGATRIIVIELSKRTRALFYECESM